MSIARRVGEELDRESTNIGEAPLRQLLEQLVKVGFVTRLEGQLDLGLPGMDVGEDPVVVDLEDVGLGFSNGGQNHGSKGANFYGWAVRSGDVSAVPVPAAVWLFGSGLLGLIGIARKKHRE